MPTLIELPDLQANVDLCTRLGVAVVLETKTVAALESSVAALRTRELL